MSRESHEWVSRLRGITLAERAVLDYMADYVNRNAVGAWPLMRTAAADLDVSASSVRLHIRKLEKKGHLERKAVYGADGAQIGNIYLLSIGLGDLRPARKARHDPYGDYRIAAVSGNEEGGCAEPDKGGEKPTAPTVETEEGGCVEPEGAAVQNVRAKEPVIEPTKEPTSEEKLLPAPPAGGTATEAGGEVDGITVESSGHPNPLRPKGDTSAVVVLIPMVASNGRPFAFTEKLVADLQPSYPAVDVRQQAQQIRQWNMSNPRKRKTPAGMRAHITGWMDREQNKGGRQRGLSELRQPGKDERPEPGAPQDREPPGGLLTRMARGNWQRLNEENKRNGKPAVTWAEFLNARAAQEDDPMAAADFPLEEAINAYADQANA